MIEEPHLRMGLTRLEGGDWLELDHPDADAQRRAKVELMADAPEDHMVIEQGPDEHRIHAAAAELGVEIGREFERQGHPRPAPEKTLHPLDAAARLVREDLVLHLERDGAVVVVAGSVCFPTRWTLAEKVGRSLDVVHGPVPGYAETLAGKVGQFMLRLKPGPGVWRRNWSIMPTGAWSLPGHHNEHLPTSEGPEGLWYRTERQTLRRLTESGAVVFTIAIDVTPLPQLDPATAADLADRIDALPDGFRTYKGLDRRPDVTAYLRSRVEP
jgi:dimethylamine monooxygenase subunit A